MGKKILSIVTIFGLATSVRINNTLKLLVSKAWIRVLFHEQILTIYLNSLDLYSHALPIQWLFCSSFSWRWSKSLKGSISWHCWKTLIFTYNHIFLNITSHGSLLFGVLHTFLLVEITLWIILMCMDVGFTM